MKKMMETKEEIKEVLDSNKEPQELYEITYMDNGNVKIRYKESSKELFNELIRLFKNDYSKMYQVVVWNTSRVDGSDINNYMLLRSKSC